MVTTYSRQLLFSLRKTHLVKTIDLKDEVKSNIDQLGIKKAYRGKRAGIKKKASTAKVQIKFNTYADCVRSNLHKINKASTPNVKECYISSSRHNGIKHNYIKKKYSQSVSTVQITSRQHVQSHTRYAITRHTHEWQTAKKPSHLSTLDITQNDIPTQNRYNLLPENDQTDFSNEQMQRTTKHISVTPKQTRKHKKKKKQIGTKRLSPTVVGLWNAQSVGNKTQIVKENILEDNIDLYFLVESWLHENSNKTIGDMCPPGYKHKQATREHKKGGGIVCIYKEHLKVQKKKPPEVTTMEILDIILTAKTKKIRYVTIYQPEPAATKNMNSFLEEFTAVLLHYTKQNEDLYICGDFNFHVNKSDNKNAQLLLEIIDSFDLVQHVAGSTHRNGNTLDLIITKKDSKLLQDHKIGLQLSDHHHITSFLNMMKEPKPKKTIRYRKYKLIDKQTFKTDIEKVVKDSDNINDNLENLVKHYNQGLRSVLDKHAPEKECQITERNPTPWTSEELRPWKKELRKLEKKMRESNLEIDKDAFKSKKNEYNEFLSKRWTDKLTKLIEDNKDNPKEMFKAIEEALNTKGDNPLPDHESDEELANEFSKEFDNKIKRIRDDLDQFKKDNPVQDEEKRYKTLLTEFRLLSQQEVKKLVLDTANKHCTLDPIPTFLLREHIDETLPLITRIVNLSLKLGNMPDSLKIAIIIPLLKKLNMELLMKNYRPVSNLAFLSKVIEKAVAIQLIDHLIKNKLMDTFQSAYRKFHSTETALLRVQNDILMGMDKGKVAILLLLDMSAAFDTIDHDILLQRLSDRCGIQGTVLKWFRSYLSNRTQTVQIGNKQSQPKQLNYGVPQGSVLGPLLFTIYTLPLGDIIKQNNTNYQIYADDNELYLMFSPNTEESQMQAKGTVEQCIKETGRFMMENKMKRNDEKTEFMLIGTQAQLQKLKFDSLQVGNATVSPTDKARNLGVIFDKEMNLKAHVSYLCSSAFYHVRNLSAIRKSLDKKSAKTAAHAFVTARLDYGNSLLYGLPDNQINRLQLIQNAAARVVAKIRKYDHITPIRKELHWLPIKARIEFKILLLTWKALHGQAPHYLSELLTIQTYNRQLRKGSQNLLKVPRTYKRTCGDRAFEKAAPQLWNSLPEKIRSTENLETFKSQLKTHLFSQYYPEAES